MEFAEEGGEGPTPYEVLLHAAMIGDSSRFTRQDSVEETWRVLQPLLDSPPGVQGYVKDSWGPEEADRLVAGHGRWHGPGSVHDPRQGKKPKKAALPSADKGAVARSTKRRRALAVSADRRLRVSL